MPRGPVPLTGCKNREENSGSSILFFFHLRVCLVAFIHFLLVVLVFLLVFLVDVVVFLLVVVVVVLYSDDSLFGFCSFCFVR